MAVHNPTGAMANVFYIPCCPEQSCPGPKRILSPSLDYQLLGKVGFSPPNAKVNFFETLTCFSYSLGILDINLNFSVPI